MAVLVIFAGGLSRRFGRDKCTYPLGGKRFIDRVAEAGRAVADRIYVAPGPNVDLYKGVDVVEDSPRFSGPLAAVDTALRLFDEEVFFAPCDVPFITPAVFKELAKADGVFSTWVFPNGRVESTVFKASPREARRALDFLAAHKRRRLDDLFRLSPTVFLSVVKHGVDTLWLYNVNTPEDLAVEKVEVRLQVFVEDVELRWDTPPLAKWLEEGDVEALKRELIRYVELGLFSMAAHVAKDLAPVSPAYKALSDVLYEAVEIEKGATRVN